MEELDNLYELAFAYRKTKLWKSLFDSELFAVALPDGEIGYCTVMGFLGEHLALALYVGEEGLDCYRSIRNPMGLGLNMLRLQEVAFSQTCLQCSFQNKDELSPEELSAARAYTGAHKLTLRGSHAFPQFTAYRAARYPWPITGGEDARRLRAALEAALAVDRALKGKCKEDLGFVEAGQMEGCSIPLLTRSGDGFEWSMHPLPPQRPRQYPEPVLEDELLLARLKRAKKSGGVWVCDVVMCPTPTVQDESSAPVFPYVLLAASRDSGMVIPSTPVMDYKDGAGDVLRELASQMLEFGIPRRIQVVDERTYSLLKGLAAALKVKLELQECSEALDELEADFLDHMDGCAEDDEGEYDGLDDDEDILGCFEDFLEELLDLDDSTLLSMPRELQEQLRVIDRQGLITPALSGRLRRLFNWPPR